MQGVTIQFHRSVYITLGLACACLGYAELGFLPAISALAGIVAVLLIVAYKVEGRWSLSITAANILGGIIFAAALAWMAHQFFADDSLITTLPFPTSLLPYLGPLLMILIPAKLFRPKHNGDYWGLHGIGLIAVALGCALTGDPVFGALMFAYVVSAVWSLALFYYYREQQRLGVSHESGRTVRRAPRSFVRATIWSIGLMIVAITLFLVTPRSTEARWEFHSAGIRMQSGIDENRPGIDLNRSGTLSSSRDRVFTAHAYTAQKGVRVPKNDLDFGQRWRHMPFNTYEVGRWDNRPFVEVQNRQSNLPRRFFEQPQEPLTRPTQALPDVQQPHFYIDFSTEMRGTARQIKAEPIWLFENGELVPSIATRMKGDSLYRWMRSADGEISPPAWTYQFIQADYVQKVAISATPGVSPLLPISESNLEHLRNCSSVPRLREWARSLLRKLVADGRMPAAAFGGSDKDIRVPPAYYEAVGRAFEAYLSSSGDFKYTLKLTREDPSIDPVEDFVLNLRRGHCSRFASALALMLRSVGIPARVVLGYRGFETDGDGSYEVLQCHAHSWVEMAFRFQNDEADLPFWGWVKDGNKWRWMTLDPTPLTEEMEVGEFTWGQWWDMTRRGLSGFFKNFIIEYDQEHQDRALYVIALGDWGAIPRAIRRLLLGKNGDDWIRACLIGLFALALTLISGKLYRRRRSRRGTTANPAISFYQRLLSICDKSMGVVPRLGQTPVEFADAAGATLRSRPATSHVADLPGAITSLYYRVRFGDQPLSADERISVDSKLDQFRSELAAAKCDR